MPETSPGMTGVFVGRAGKSAELVRAAEGFRRQHCVLKFGSQ
jgi:hypothetical protein